MRTNSKRVQELVRLVENGNWFDHKRALWVMSFVIQLTKLGASVRRNDSRGRRAAIRLAYHLGQLVDDPIIVREEELDEQKLREVRYLRARANNLCFSCEFSESDRWSVETSVKAIEGSVADARLTNDLLRQFLVEFGILEKLSEAFPAMHTSFDDESDPLFTEEAWPRWWRWAKADFFGAEETEELPAV